MTKTLTKKFNIKINKAWCKKCGICIDFCPKNVLSRDIDGFPEVVNINDCLQFKCQLCELRCPDFAIRLVSEEE